MVYVIRITVQIIQCYVHHVITNCHSVNEFANSICIRMCTMTFPVGTHCTSMSAVAWSESVSHCDSNNANVFR